MDTWLVVWLYVWGVPLFYSYMTRISSGDGDPVTMAFSAFVWPVTWPFMILGAAAMTALDIWRHWR